MKLGLILVGRTARADLELARRAEAAGFAAVFVTEFFNRHSFARLGAIAAATERVTVGTAIANAFIRSPMVLASAALDLDELSGGRMVLGLGSGTRRMNEDWYATPFAQPAARTRELVALLRAVLEAGQGPGFAWESEHWRIRIPAYGRAAPVRRDLPIWVAGVNRGMIAAAGAVADGLVGHPIHSRRWHREVTLPGLRAAATAAGRAPSACPLVPYVTTSIQRDRELAVRDAKRQIGFYFTTRLYHSVLELHGLGAVGEACTQALRSFDLEAMADAIPDALVDEIAVACTPDEAAARLERWRELTELPLIYPAALGVPPERLEANFESILGLAGAVG